MNLLAITCYAGEKPFVDMTANMLTDLIASIHVAQGNRMVSRWAIAVFAQGTRGARPPHVVGTDYPIFFLEEDKNQGYAYGMNSAYRIGLQGFPQADATLCINNDILMPHKDWLSKLVAEYRPLSVLCPKTNYTSVHEQRAKAPEDKPPYDHGVTPAVCWLMSRRITRELEAHTGQYKLFPEDLGGRAWGEDNYAAGVIRTKIDPAPFRIVPRAWIHHLGAKTSHLIPADERMKAHHEAHRRMKREGLR